DGTLAHVRDELLDHRQRHVRLEQRHAHLAQRGLDVVLGQAPAAADLLKTVTEPFTETIEHEATNWSRRIPASVKLPHYKHCAAPAGTQPRFFRIGQRAMIITRFSTDLAC